MMSDISTLAKPDFSGNQKINKVVIVEDDRTIASALCDKINEADEFQCQHIFSSPEEFMVSGIVSPDIILLDLMFADSNGLDFIEKILQRYPNAGIIINSIKDDTNTIFDALKKGALGYIDKQSPDVNLHEVLMTVARGGGYMTPKTARKVMQSFRQPFMLKEKLSARETEITKLIIEGLTYQMIATKLDLSIDTIRTYIKSIYRKLNVNSKGQLFNMSKDLLT